MDHQITSDPLTFLKERCQSLQYASTMILGAHNRCTFQVTLKVNEEKVYIATAPTTPLALRKAVLFALKDVETKKASVINENEENRTKEISKLLVQDQPATIKTINECNEFSVAPLVVKNPLQRLKKSLSDCNKKPTLKLPKIEGDEESLNETNKINKIENCNESTKSLPELPKKNTNTHCQNNSITNNTKEQLIEIVNTIEKPSFALIQHVPAQVCVENTNHDIIDTVDSDDDPDPVIIMPKRPTIDLSSSDNECDTERDCITNPGNANIDASDDIDDIAVIAEETPTIDLAMNDDNEDVSVIPTNENTATIDLANDNKDKDEIINECVFQLLGDEVEEIMTSTAVELNDNDKDTCEDISEGELEKPLNTTTDTAIENQAINNENPLITYNSNQRNVMSVPRIVERQKRFVSGDRSRLRNVTMKGRDFNITLCDNPRNVQRRQEQYRDRIPQFRGRTMERGPRLFRGGMYRHHNNAPRNRHTYVQSRPYFRQQIWEHERPSVNSNVCHNRNPMDNQQPPNVTNHHQISENSIESNNNIPWDFQCSRSSKRPMNWPRSSDIHNQNSRNSNEANNGFADNSNATHVFKNRSSMDSQQFSQNSKELENRLTNISNNRRPMAFPNSPNVLNQDQYSQHHSTEPNTNITPPMPPELSTVDILENLNKLCPGIRYNLEAEMGSSSSDTFFLMSAIFNKCKYYGDGKTRELACIEVAKKILAVLNNIIPHGATVSGQQQRQGAISSKVQFNIVPQTPEGYNLNEESTQPFGNMCTLSLPQYAADTVENLVLKRFNQLTTENPELRQCKSLAAVVMTRNLDFQNGQVVALATGTKCIHGSKIDGNGSVLNDSHAEVIARRCLMKFLYTQLKWHANPELEESSIFSKNPSGLQCAFALKAEINFHLYMSDVPCGDARLCTDGGAYSEHGQLRTKLYGGLITEAIGNRFYQQSWNSIKSAKEPLLIMSCSDKIARWNVLGLQGSLLSTLTEPIYLYSIVLGCSYDTKHVYRAVCGRLEQKLNYLPKPYHLNRPLLGRATNNRLSPSEFIPNIGINWTYGDRSLDIVSLHTGRLIDNTISYISKQMLFAKYIYLLQNVPNINIRQDSNNYGHNKEKAKNYAIAKQELFDAFQHAGLGCWIKKPYEQNNFTI
ncbi:uncharacterized protein [Musca autumnalis]|uniref:uncharacterized protein n=1 Tax=Musca autumnalis TaxID=221902 RepID=UPI003CFA41BD